MESRSRVRAWKRCDVTSCNCPSLGYIHTHCPCDRCGGRAVSRSVEFRHWKNACGLASSLKEKKSVYVLDSERSPSSLSSSQLPAVDDLIRDNSTTILHYVASTEGQTVFTGTGSSSCSMPERVDDEMDEATSTLLQDLEPRGGLNLGPSAVDNLDCTTALLDQHQIYMMT